MASMIYTQWLERYLELSYMGQWVDESWFQRFVAMVERTALTRDFSGSSDSAAAMATTSMPPNAKATASRPAATPPGPPSSSRT